ncbi:hypothetical protein L3Q82_025558 [Scortum barcoo]|uniref:Uncharacterized protein n=1 Tax=Scortum barcoo TaxID=214431 RepID=A0ACB8WM57_9TELE|nr:hypothetical protein L3Q82_025558 [Scortum barcoo]
MYYKCCHVSGTDVLLLKDEPNPKCFTRTEMDFTCFFETADNRIYDFFYTDPRTSPPGEKRCEMSVQRTEEGSFLHICSFPASDVFVYVETYLKVVERSTNTSLYSRTVFVEQHFLLDPPFNMSLHQNGREGQLQVSWDSNNPKILDDRVIYRVRYSSKGMGEKTKNVEAKVGYILESLVPGEEVEVQVAVKSNSDEGHWSSWSQPARAMVPQSAEDISLMCYTSDLQNITCQWNGSRYGVEIEYKLFYKMDLGEAPGTTEWTECLAERGLTDLCRFHGNESRKIRVKLSSAAAALNRTFYTKEFTLNSSIKTSPPSHLRRTFERDKLCLEWEAPLPSLWAHLSYEVGYQIRRGEAWLTVPLKGKNHICLDVPTGRQYSAKVRAKPGGFIYSGHWSDWSEVLTGDTPTDKGTWLLLCITISVLITAVIPIILYSRYYSKLKQYIWPPVPNLDKVLQAYMTEINGERWNLPMTAKQCCEETTSSVVEVMSEGEVSELGTPTEESTELLSPEKGFPRWEQADGSSGTQVFPDYVTLNKDSVILCPKGNKYVGNQLGEKEGQGVSDGPVYLPPCLGNDFLNHSYLSLTEPAHTLDCKATTPRGPGNLYTNFPCG